eukprot:scaffold13643_cov110-Isochrysis_galbana.AAC.2
MLGQWQLVPNLTQPAAACGTRPGAPGRGSQREGAAHLVEQLVDEHKVVAHGIWDPGGTRTGCEQCKPTLPPCHQGLWSVRARATVEIGGRPQQSWHAATAHPR